MDAADAKQRLQLVLATRRVQDYLLSGWEQDRIDNDPRWAICTADALGAEPLSFEEMSAEGQFVLEHGLTLWTGRYSDEQMPLFRDRWFAALVEPYRHIDWDEEEAGGRMSGLEIARWIKESRQEDRAASARS
jgi:hypothetical protein